ncbi:hypothetical protein [Bacillus phage BC-T25]|nr:hypothetical protein [Bacillus phage BC-T25]
MWYDLLSILVAFIVAGSFEMLFLWLAYAWYKEDLRQDQEIIDRVKNEGRK